MDYDDEIGERAIEHAQLSLTGLPRPARDKLTRERPVAPISDYQ